MKAADFSIATSPTDSKLLHAPPYSDVVAFLQALLTASRPVSALVYESSAEPFSNRKLCVHVASDVSVMIRRNWIESEQGYEFPIRLQRRRREFFEG
jgi:hypothetical protein